MTKLLKTGIATIEPICSSVVRTLNHALFDQQLPSITTQKYASRSKDQLSCFAVQLPARPVRKQFASL